MFNAATPRYRIRNTIIQQNKQKINKEEKHLKKSINLKQAVNVMHKHNTQGT